MKNKDTKIQNENADNEKSPGLEIFYQHADKIDEICRRRLPDGVINDGILAGREPEIRQDALQMLMSGFLVCNPRFAAAKKEGNLEAIEFEIERSTAIALSNCKKRLASTLADEKSGQIELTEQHGGSCKHPYDRDIHEWMPDMRIKMVMEGLQIALKEKQLSQRNGGLVKMILKEGKSINEVAALRCVTPNAIYQQLQRVQTVLPKFMSRLDP